MIYLFSPFVMLHNSNVVGQTVSEIYNCQVKKQRGWRLLLVGRMSKRYIFLVPTFEYCITTPMLVNGCIQFPSSNANMHKFLIQQTIVMLISVNIGELSIYCCTGVQRFNKPQADALKLDLTHT